jgi:hypothetical protein
LKKETRRSLLVSFLGFSKTTYRENGGDERQEEEGETHSVDGVTSKKEGEGRRGVFFFFFLVN